MSEFIAEAQVLIVPNTAAFAASLKAQVEAAVAKAGPVAIPVVAAPVAAGTAAATTAQKELAVATRERAVAEETAGHAASVNARATQEEAVASRAAATASKQLALAQTQVEGAASGVGAAQIRNTRSAAALASAQKSLAAALASQNLELEIAAAGHLQLAEAEHLNALAALEHARAMEVQAARSSQVTRAFLAQGAAAAGLRGAVLSSTAAFLGATIAAVALAKSIKGASDLNEEINKTEEVFKGSAEEILKWSETTASSLGIAQVEALSAVGTFGELFRTLGVGIPQASQLSQTLVSLSADLASFFNAPSPETVLNALQSGLVGQARPLRQFGIFLTEARVKQEALIETGKKSIDSLNQQDRILARYNLILRDSAIASGDFQRTQERLANQTRIFTANIKNLGDEIGGIFLPNIEAAIQDVNKLFFAVSKLKDFKAHITLIIESQIPGGEDGITGKILGTVLGFAGPGGALKLNLLGLKAVGKGLDLIGLSAAKAAPEVQTAAGYLDAADRAARNAAFSILIASRSMDTLAASSGKAAAELLKIQSQGGGAAAQLPAARNQLAADQAILEEALSLAPSEKGRATAIRKAREAIVSDRALIESLTGEITAAAEQASTDAAQKRAAAAEKQANQTVAFIEKFTGAGSKLQEALSRAASNDNFKKQIAINKAIIENDKKEIAALKTRIEHLHLHGEALKAAQAAIQAANKEIQAARDAIVDAQKARQEALRAALDQRLDLRIQLAQARDNVAAEIKARTARLEDITKRLAKLKNAGKKNTLAWLELKVQQQEEIKAINDLKKTQDEKKNAQSSAFFAFLQAQQGFAANLLGNLIPGFATRGLVGGGSSTGPAAGAAFSDLGASPGKGVQQTAAIGASQAAGVRPVQVDTTNQLLRQILAAVSGRGRPAPETVHNRRVGSAMMDTLGGIHGA